MVLEYQWNRIKNLEKDPLIYVPFVKEQKYESEQGKLQQVGLGKMLVTCKT